MCKNPKARANENKRDLIIYLYIVLNFKIKDLKTTSFLPKMFSLLVLGKKFVIEDIFLGKGP